MKETIIKIKLSKRILSSNKKSLLLRDNFRRILKYVDKFCDLDNLKTKE